MKQQRISPAHGGFGEYDQDHQFTEETTEDEVFSSLQDQGLMVYELGVDELPGSVEDIRGRIHNQEGRIFAVEIDDDQGGVEYFSLVD